CVYSASLHDALPILSILHWENFYFRLDKQQELFRFMKKLLNSHQNCMALILKNVWQSVMHPLVIMNQRFIYTIILKVMIPIHFLSMDLPHFNNMKINQLYMLGNDL